MTKRVKYVLYIYVDRRINKACSAGFCQAALVSAKRKYNYCLEAGKKVCHSSIEVTAIIITCDACNTSDPDVLTSLVRLCLTLSRLYSTRGTHRQKPPPVSS